jgi:hypothetical protein
MSILGKTIDAIKVRDLEELLAAASTENGELEFKGDLPFKPEKSDRWIEKGDRGPVLKGRARPSRASSMPALTPPGPPIQSEASVRR